MIIVHGTLEMSDNRELKLVQSLVDSERVRMCPVRLSIVTIKPA